MTASSAQTPGSTGSWWRDDTALVTGLPLLALATGLWLLAGPLGLVAAVLVTVVWLVFPAVVAAAVGQVAVVAVSTPETPLPTLLLVEGALVALLAAPAAVAYTGRAAGWIVGTVVVLGVSVAWLTTTLPLWLAAVATVLALGTGTYGIHRYGLLKLGVLDPMAAEL